MIGRSATRCAANLSRISSSHSLLRAAAKLCKSGTNGVKRASTLSATLQSRLAKGSMPNSSFVAVQEKYGKFLSKNFSAISAACDSPQVLVELLIQTGISTDLQEDDEEMSSVSGKKKHRRKQKY
ncbi:uncharacterized protein LOC116301254 [Actinia tenebrosa]|uniref:Uncharacterized protein LOC116301254 n=1 Tax=Actinia tenebrosa TaxID=6105 RepID=A0A6P8IHK2_ACTTE|nr:uncharacterized protein LOC116301254 [Actinia tenebrosa]